MSKQKRTDESVLQSARAFAKFAPGLKKYRRRKTLKKFERDYIIRKEKLLRFHTQHLIPVSKKLARELRGVKFGPGINAVEFRNTSPNATVRKVGDDLTVTSNGRTYLYWHLDREDITPKGMTAAARKAFAIDDYEEEFGGEEREPDHDRLPIERVAELADIAFAELKPLAVYLWAPTGRVGDGHRSLKQFTMWLAENWQTDRYSQQEKWVNGIAILLNDPEFGIPKPKPQTPKGRDPRIPHKRRRKAKS